MECYVLERLGLEDVYVQKLDLDDKNATRFTDELAAAQSFNKNDLTSVYLNRAIKYQQLKLVRVIPC